MAEINVLDNALASDDDDWIVKLESLEKESVITSSQFKASTQTKTKDSRINEGGWKKGFLSKSSEAAIATGNQSVVNNLKAVHTDTSPKSENVKILQQSLSSQQNSIEAVDQISSLKKPAFTGKIIERFP